MAKLEGRTWSVNSHSPKHIQGSWLKSSLRCLQLFGLWKSQTPTPSTARSRSMWSCQGCWARWITGQLRHWKSIIHSYLPSLPQAIRGEFWQRNKRLQALGTLWGSFQKAKARQIMSYLLRQWKTFALLCWKLKNEDPQDCKGLFTCIPSRGRSIKSFVRITASSFRESFPIATLGMLCWPLLFSDCARINN